MEVCKVRYNESHVYFKNLLTCLSMANRLSAQRTISDFLRRDLIPLSMSEDDEFICKYPDDNKFSKAVLSNKTKYSKHAPAVLRSFSVNTRSGFLDRSHVLKLKEGNEKVVLDELNNLGFNKALCYEVVDAERVWNWGYVKSLILDDVKLSILSGDIEKVLALRSLYEKLLFQEKVSKFRNKTIQKVSITGDLFVGIKYQVFNQEMVNDTFICITSTFEVLQRKGLFKNIDTSFGNVRFRTPFGNIGVYGSLTVNVDKEFSNIIQKLEGCKAVEIFLVMKTLREHRVRYGDKVTPNSVLSCGVGPYIFWGNAEQHSTKSYMERLGLKSEVELLAKSPSFFVRGFIGDQIVKNPELFALFASADFVESTTDGGNIIEKNTSHDMIISHPDIKVPSIKVENYEIESVIVNKSEILKFTPTGDDVVANGN